MASHYLPHASGEGLRLSHDSDEGLALYRMQWLSNHYFLYSCDEGHCTACSGYVITIFCILVMKA